MAPGRDVKIALVYQAEQAHQHMKAALVELGGQVVYESTVGKFAHPDLDASGADVIVINLDPEVNEEFDALGDLLDDEHRKVVINDGEVSSRLEGWDLARWTRHLAAKILDVEDVNPPRPAGAEAIPVKVRTATVEHVPATPAAPAADFIADASFELGAAELADALSADTDTSLSANRSRLTTDEEPVRVEIERVDEPGEYQFDPSTFDLPGDDAPLAKLPSLDTATPQESDADLAASLADFGFLDISDEPAQHGEKVEGLDDLLLRAGEQEEEMRKGSLGKPQSVAPGAKPAPGPAKPTAPVAKGAPAAPAKPTPGAAPGRPAPVEAKKPGAPEPARPAAPARGAPARAGEPVKQRSLADFESALSGLSLESLDDDTAPKPGSPFAPGPAPEAEKPKAAPGPSAQQRAAEKFDLSKFSLEALEEPEAEKPAPPPPLGKDAPKEAAKPKPPSAQQRAAESFDLSAFSLEALEGDEASAAPTTGRASFGAPEASPATPKAAAAAPKPAPAPAPPPPGPAPADDLLSLEGFDFSFDENVEIKTDSIVRLGSDAAIDDLAADLDSEIDALLADEDEQPKKAYPVTRVCVLGASIGGPEAVREFLSTIPANIPVLFLLAQHMGADFLELMTQQLAKATKLKVRVPSNGETLKHGEVAVVPLTERIQIDHQGAVDITITEEASPYTPSIDRVLVDAADAFGADSMAIIFSGMAHDAIDGTKHMHLRGGTIWVQDPSTCVISSMIDGAKEAGVVSFEGSPSELAKKFVQEFGAR